GQGSGTDACIASVCGSRKSRRACASATTIIERPSGVKYMLYGSATGSEVPGRLVRGSIGVRLPPLLLTHSVRMSQDGTTCCGWTPVGNMSTTENVDGSITLTVPEPLFGTYTRGRSRSTAGRRSPTP